MGTVKIILIFVMLTVAVIQDIKKGRISNKYNVLWGACGLLISFLAEGVDGLGRSLIGVIIPFLALVLLFAIHVLGAGDIKLFMALGAFSGMNIIWLLMYSFIICGIYGLVLMCGRLIRYFNSKDTHESLLDSLTRGRLYTKVPFSIFILGAFLWYLMKGGIFVGI